ncbi:MAG: hypothetical protein WCW26_05680 [Candidatus Buchananbacteria bacterium]
MEFYIVEYNVVRSSWSKEQNDIPAISAGEDRKMLGLISVTCPHCGAQGQIMAPPHGSIIIGPCPECQGTVAIFMGAAVALDGNILKNGSPAEKTNHVSDRLCSFIRERVGRIFDSSDEFTPESQPEMATAQSGSRSRFGAQAPATPISEQELEKFTKTELELLDDPNYFRTIFG